MSVEMKILSSHSDWLEARRNYIGGSDAAAVLGMNPYKTNIELWQEKTGQLTPEDISDKPYVQYGTQAEMHLRGLFRLDFPEYEVHYVENNLWLNDKYPFAHASLDGWLTEKETGRKGILEIKTSNILQSQQKEKWNERIPDNYYIQTLWYMAVTEFEFVILKANLKTVFNGVPYIQTKHYRIERADVEADIEYLMKKGSEFWEYVKTGKKPPLALPQI
jgi:putative phage-type endonuclease